MYALLLQVILCVTEHSLVGCIICSSPPEPVSIAQIRETAGFLIEVMPLMFIPAGVGLLKSWGLLKPILLPVCVIVAVSTVLVMGISGLVTQEMIGRNKKKEE